MNFIIKNSLQGSSSSRFSFSSWRRRLKERKPVSKHETETKRFLFLYWKLKKASSWALGALNVTEQGNLHDWKFGCRVVCITSGWFTIVSYQNEFLFPKISQMLNVKHCYKPPWYTVKCNIWLLRWHNTRWHMITQFIYDINSDSPLKNRQFHPVLCYP